jgi:phosphate transport system permease protein
MSKAEEPTRDTPQISLRATGRGRRRLLVNRAAEWTAVLAAASAIGVLALVIWSVGSRGIGAIDVDFFLKGPPLFGQTGGGIAPALVGSLLVVAIATVIALPVGVLTAIFVSEFSPRPVAHQIRLWLDVLNGFPSIVIGIFVFALCVKVKVPGVGIGGHQSAIAGGFALSVIMLPLVARSTMEVLALVPGHLREASFALGVSKWQTVLRVVLPSAFGGILTGTTLAIARAAGETAPLLFTCALAGQVVDWNPTHSVLSIPLTIFEYSESADPTQHQQAWAAAFVLILFVLVTSLTARLLLDRSRRRLGTAR